MAGTNTITTSDGAVFGLQREQIHGEGTWHSIMFKPAGADRFLAGFERPEGFELPEGSSRKRVVERRLARAAREYEERRRAHG